MQRLGPRWVGCLWRVIPSSIARNPDELVKDESDPVVLGVAIATERNTIVSKARKGIGYRVLAPRPGAVCCTEKGSPEAPLWLCWGCRAG